MKILIFNIFNGTRFHIIEKSQQVYTLRMSDHSHFMPQKKVSDILYEAGTGKSYIIVGPFRVAY